MVEDMDRAARALPRSDTLSRTSAGIPPRRARTPPPTTIHLRLQFRERHCQAGNGRGLGAENGASERR